MGRTCGTGLSFEPDKRVKVDGETSDENDELPSPDGSECWQYDGSTNGRRCRVICL